MLLKYGRIILNIIFILLPLTVQAEDNPTTTVNVPAPTAPHEVSSTLCGACHVEIFKEWKGSMHAKSSALNDPIHAAFYKNVMGDPTEEGVNKKGKYPVCLRCHAPNAALQKKTKLDAKPAFAEGINCVYCHTISGFKGTKKDNGKSRLGQAAYTNSTTSLQAPSGKTYSTLAQPENPSPVDPAFHPFPLDGKNGPMFKANELCMGCHDHRNNSKGVQLCATGVEFENSGSQVNCQSCHMPMVNGHANHSWAGGHDKNMLRKALKLDLVLEKSDSKYKAKVTIKNLLPHKFPTGSPFRDAYLKVTAYNAKGDTVWKSSKNHPIKDDKNAMMVYVLGDGKGKPSMPPKAKEVLSDTRLKPHETRVLNYDVSGEGIKVVRAEVFYNLLPPKLLKKLDKVLTPDLKETKSVAMAEAVLK